MVLLIIFLFVGIIAKLIYLQLVDGKRLQVLAAEQWARDIPVIGERGDIKDVNGNILADTKTGYSLYARPNSIKDKEKTARVLSGVLGLDFGYILEKISKKVSEITISKKLTAEQISMIYANDVTGIYYSQNVQREYTYGDFLSSVLGFTNIDGSGQTGIELLYDEYLKGKNGYILTETDLVGREIDTGKTYYVKGAKGANVYLTIDYAIQRFVQNAVNEAYESNKAKSASCIVMNPKTGAIVALAQSPSFNLNDIPRNDVAKLLELSKNTVVSNVYEPGSTFKVLTAAIGMENGFVNDGTRVYCPGYRIVDGKRIKCWRTIGHGSQKFNEAVENSCNCMFMDIALGVGKDKLYDGLINFGINEKTGVNLLGEGSGIMISRDLLKNVDIARIGFGQAVAVTAIELLTATASVINGGELLTPYIVDRIETDDGETLFKGEKKVRRNVVSQKTSEKMRAILEGVVNNGGGKNAKVDGFRIGGKTGTAQKYLPDGRGIDRGKYVATFMGFCPADDPEYILLFIVDEPSAGPYYGSIVSAPQAAKIFEQIINYKGWKKQIEEEPKKVFEMPDLIGLSLTKAITILKENNMYYELDGEYVGDSIVKEQIPAPGSSVTEDNVVLIRISE